MMPNENAIASDVAPQPHRTSSDEISNTDGADASRRQALCGIAAAFAASAGLPRGLAAMISTSAEPLTKPFRFNAVDRAGALRPGGVTRQSPGQIGEFNFLAGSWKISHRMLKANRIDWDDVSGEATCWTILGGVGSVEELRIPARNFSGMGLRLLDLERKEWSDFWCNAKSGVLGNPGTPGSFVDGVGSFIVDDEDNGQKVKIRGVWDQITPTSCRWRQGSSRDGGATWVDNWIMQWVRA